MGPELPGHPGQQPVRNQGQRPGGQRCAADPGIPERRLGQHHRGLRGLPQRHRKHQRPRPAPGHQRVLHQGDGRAALAERVCRRAHRGVRDRPGLRRQAHRADAAVQPVPLRRGRTRPGPSWSAGPGTRQRRRGGVHRGRRGEHPRTAGLSARPGQPPGTAPEAGPAAPSRANPPGPANAGPVVTRTHQSGSGHPHARRQHTCARRTHTGPDWPDAGARTGHIVSGDSSAGHAHPGEWHAQFNSRNAHPGHRHAPSWPADSGPSHRDAGHCPGGARAAPQRSAHRIAGDRLPGTGSPATGSPGTGDPAAQPAIPGIPAAGANTGTPAQAPSPAAMQAAPAGAPSGGAASGGAAPATASPGTRGQRATARATASAAPSAETMAVRRLAAPVPPRPRTEVTTRATAPAGPTAPARPASGPTRPPPPPVRRRTDPVRARQPDRPGAGRPGRRTRPDRPIRRVRRPRPGVVAQPPPRPWAGPRPAPPGHGPSCVRHQPGLPAPDADRGQQRGHPGPGPADPGRAAVP